jgi:putative protease
MNICNHGALEFLKVHGVKMAAVSLELSPADLREMIQNAIIPLEVVIHGTYAAMLCDHNIPAFSLSPKPFSDTSFPNRRYALLDEAGERHPIRIDQYGRNHILFAKDLCLYSYLGMLSGIASYRIEAQDYTPEWVGRLTAFYRRALDAIGNGMAGVPTIDEIVAASPRKLGVGAFRFQCGKEQGVI